MSRSRSKSVSRTTSRSLRDALLEEQPYFHGILPREEIRELLVNNGDFLLRESRKPNGECQIVLSCFWDKERHFIITPEADGKFRLEGNDDFASIPALVAHYLKTGKKLTQRSGAVLKKPVKQQKWELKNEDVVREKMLGKGNFGEVWKGTLKSHNNMAVAIKTCSASIPEEERRKFLREARIMRSYIHPNVTRIIGVCAYTDPMMIVIELMPNGALNSYLKKYKGTNKVSVNERIRFCSDSACGMQYLESQRCIHRDLAARNCLLSKANVVKISDFGMSREAVEYKVEGAKQIPIKWTAPEALEYGTYTSKSDVWSYGILIWEIFSDAATPYPGMKNAETVAFIQGDYRMNPAPNTPAWLAKLMKQCWEWDPKNRPTFSDLKRKIMDATSTKTRSRSSKQTIRNSPTIDDADKSLLEDQTQRSSYGEVMEDNNAAVADTSNSLQQSLKIKRRQSAAEPSGTAIWWKRDPTQWTSSLGLPYWPSNEQESSVSQSSSTSALSKNKTTKHRMFSKR